LQIVFLQPVRQILLRGIISFGDEPLSGTIIEQGFNLDSVYVQFAFAYPFGTAQLNSRRFLDRYYQ